jgi:hypothetical protein
MIQKAVFLILFALTCGYAQSGSPQSMLTLCPPSGNQPGCILQDATAGDSNTVKWTALAVTPPTSPAGPFQQQFDLKIANGANAVFGRIDVPANLQFEIESVSVYGKLPSGQVPTVSISTALRGSPASYFFSLVKQDSDSGTDWLIGNQAMRLYADSPSVFVLLTRRQTAGEAAFSISISGNLILPPQ